MPPVSYTAKYEIGSSGAILLYRDYEGFGEALRNEKVPHTPLRLHNMNTLLRLTLMTMISYLGMTWFNSKYPEATFETYITASIPFLGLLYSINQIFKTN